MQPITSEVITLTPELAQAYLARNHGNRQLRESYVKRWAEEIKSGSWRVTHQGLAFDTNGDLIDGQHRCAAVVRTGIAVPMLVTYNVPRDNFTVFDQGLRRTPADITGLPKQVASVVRVVASLVFATTAPTPAMLSASAEVVGPAAAELEDFCSAHAVYFSAAAMRVAIITRVAMGEDKDYIYNLYNKLARNIAEDLPPIAYALIKQRLRGTTNSNDALGVLARGMQLYDKKLAFRHVIKTTGVEEATGLVKRMFKQKIMEVYDSYTK